jgi:effector-binding domain-containing protein
VQFSAYFSWAVTFNECAVLVSGSAAAAVGYFSFLGWYTATVGEVGFAEAAVHAAGGDEFRSKFGVHNEGNGCFLLKCVVNMVLAKNLMHPINSVILVLVMVPALSRLECMVAAHVYSLNQPPEEEALDAALRYAKNNGLTEKTSRLFGRNIYLADQPEPHGYEYYVTAEKIEPSNTVEVGEVPGGFYAVLDVKNLFNIPESWKTLIEWVEANGYRAIGVKRGPQGWVNSAYEELLDWQQQKPPEEWRFRLWMQLQE